ncbi:methyltransferase domain-containing protein [archaeon]|nr:methyltransferase domain-containing protein [archaeon]
MAIACTKLNLGCGKAIKQGYINVDKEAFEGVDKLLDLEKFPYPFKDNTFELVDLDNTFEHLSSQVRALEEIWRICKPNAIVNIFSPHFASMSTFQDPTHKRGVSWNYFTFFDKENKRFCDYNFKCNFRTISKEILFPNYLFWIKPFANLFPEAYEANLCFIFRPSYMRIRLRVVK